MLVFKDPILGFVAGFVGEAIEAKINLVENCETDFIKLKNGISRVNVKIHSKEESEINGQGPIVSRSDVKELFNKLDALKDGDILVLAGSIPNSLPTNIYKNIITRLKDKDIKVVVDAEKDLIMQIISYKPFLIKPNHKELEEIFDTEINTKDDVIKYAKKLQDDGAQNVLVSLGAEGAILLTSDGGVFEAEAPTGAVVNPVGSGDSMIAGFLAGYLNSQDYSKAFKLGLASGSASAFSEDLATGEEILSLLSRI